MCYFKKYQVRQEEKPTTLSQQDITKFHDFMIVSIWNSVKNYKSHDVGVDSFQETYTHVQWWCE
jgi:hypothetical protein